MALTTIQMILNFLSNTLWPLCFFICTAYTICKCCTIHCNNKLKGGGYVAQYYPNITDPDIKEMIKNHLEKTEQAIQLKVVQK